MAGGTFKGLRPMFAQISRDVRFATEGLEDQVRQIIEEESEWMAERMRHYISVRATPKVKAGTWTAPREGRIVTGKMHDSVKVEVAGGQTQITTRVGWVDKNPHYALFQDHGFTHVNSNEFIEGMNSMVDAYMEMRARIEERLRDLGLRGTSF